MFLIHAQSLMNAPEATLPINTHTKAAIQGILSLHSDCSTNALVYPHLSNASLLSIGQLYNEGCIAIFDKRKLLILKNGNIILFGARNLSDDLLDVLFKQN